MNKNSPETIDEYIAGFPAHTKKLLQQTRAIIKKAAPAAGEKISYGIPTFTLDGNLVHFGGFKNHIGFFPAASAIKAFQKQLAAYKGAKGSVQFPLTEPLPVQLITKMVQYRVKENKAKAAAKQKAKPVIQKQKAGKLSDEEVVKAYMNTLSPAAKKEIDAVRTIIKKANSKLGERIKWNAPSYYYKEDILTFGPYRTQKLLLVVHHPAVVTLQSPLLEGDFPNRRLIRFSSKTAAEKNKKELTRIINSIIEAIDKNKKK